MYARLPTPFTKSSFLFGPRGTGKSAWVRDVFPGALVFDLLDSGLYAELAADPTRLGERIPKGHKSFVVLDEVQKAPALLDEVHRLIETRKLRFVLTGSSARKLRRGGANLLAGRAHTNRMHPLTAVELGPDFRLSHSLKYGHLPMAYTQSRPAEYLRAYAGTYLREEVLQEGFTRNLGAFARFLEQASLGQGQLLNTAALARDAAVTQKTAEGYIDLLEDLLLSVRLPSFTKRAKRRVVQHPKFYIFDAGVFRAIRPKGPLDTPEEEAGAALETLAMQELRAHNDYGNCGYTMHHYRTSAGHEVDFVLYGERGIRAFEVKRAAKVRAADLKGLQVFLADYPMAKATLVYGGSERRYEGEIELVPAEEWFRELPAFLE